MEKLVIGTPDSLNDELYSKALKNIDEQKREIQELSNKIDRIENECKELTEKIHPNLISQIFDYEKETENLNVQLELGALPQSIYEKHLHEIDKLKMKLREQKEIMDKINLKKKAKELLENSIQSKQEKIQHLKDLLTLINFSKSVSLIVNLYNELQMELENLNKILFEYKNTDFRKHYHSIPQLSKINSERPSGSININYILRARKEFINFIKNEIESESN